VRAELGCEPGTPLAGMLACLKPQKAPVDFVRVASRVVERVPNARFFIAGDGVLRPEVEAEIARCGLEGRFFLLGWRRDVRALLAASDVMVLTSLHEGLPRALIQALAAGRPIVASRVDGVPEAVEEGRNGHVLEPGDVAGFAERLTSVMSNPGLARRMGEEGAKRVAAFDWRRGVAELESLYDRLLEATPH
jgi:glycosyltransferase involved in cell wall biosynthesis